MALADGVQLAAPVVEAPESVIIGEDFTVAVEPVPGAEHYQLILFDSPDPETWNEMAEVTVDGTPETMTLSTDDVPPGEYTWWVGVWYGDDVMNGDKTTGTVQVMQPEPVVDAPESVVIGEDFTVAVETVPFAEHCQIILFDTRNDPEDIGQWIGMGEAIVDSSDPGTMTRPAERLARNECRSRWAP